MISEDEWKNIEETLYLSSIPGYVENIKNGREFNKLSKAVGWGEEDKDIIEKALERNLDF